MSTTTWESTGLDPLHVEWMRESAISPEVAKAAGLESIHDAKQAAKLFGRVVKHWEGHLPALSIPYPQPGQRDPVLHRGRPSKPFERRKADGSLTFAKYVQASGTGTHLYFPPSLLRDDVRKDVTRPLLATEGEKKALAADSAGYACVALPGVTQWHVKGEKTLHPELASIALKEREVFLCFDADALTNAQVRKQELAFGRALEAEGARVRIVRFPENAQKLDDFLATREASEFAGLLEDARKNGRLPTDTSGASSEDWKAIWASLRIDPDTDRPVRDIDNLVEIFASHPAWKGAVAYDARWERVTLTRELPCGGPKNSIYPRGITDADETAARLWLVRERSLGWRKAPSLSDVGEALSAAAQRSRFDAVASYLKSVEWDGVERVRRVATEYLGAEDTLYHREVVARWLLSAVARARTPGCKVDNVLVLEGAQGIGKSTAFEVLAGDGHYSGSLPAIGTKEAMEHCVGPWIIELQELAATSKSDVEHVKAFLSERAPRFRHSYGRRTSDHPRRCVFGATTNDSGYLRDSTGNRRFWPVRCGVIDLEALRRDRDQIWAEALVRVRAGEAWHLDTRELQDAATEEQEARGSDADTWVEVAEKLLMRRSHLTVADLLDEVGIETRHQDQRVQNRASRAFRAIGLERMRIRRGFEKPTWVYMRPVASKQAEFSGITGNTGNVASIRNHSNDPTDPSDPTLSKDLIESSENSAEHPLSAHASQVSSTSAGSGGITGITGQRTGIASDFRSHSEGQTGITPPNRDHSSSEWSMVFDENEDGEATE